MLFDLSELLMFTGTLSIVIAVDLGPVYMQACIVD